MKSSNSKERLMELMRLFDLKQTDIAKRTGLDKSTISYYLSGKREPAQDNIFIIANTFNVDPAWIMGYDVPMVNKSFQESVNDKFSDEIADLLAKVQNDDFLINALKKLCVFDSQSRLIADTLLQNVYITQEKRLKESEE